MKSIKDLIKPDSRSKGWTPEWISEQFTRVPISEKVPDNIKELIDLAQNLAYYGYFKYEFYDLVIFNLCLTLEAALKTKYNNRKHGFSRLINRAKRDELFPEPFKKKINHIKKLRNNHAHPNSITIIPLFIRAFHLTTYLINCIFDDKARKVYPPMFAKEIKEAKRNQILWEALFRISKYSISPDQSFAVAGAAKSYEMGSYKCIKCNSKQIISKNQRELQSCEKCGETIFLLID